METRYNRFKHVVRREVNRIASRPIYLIALFVIPLFSIVYLATLFGNGQIENIPIGIVDQSNTQLSRKIIREISASPILNTSKKSRNNVQQYTYLSEKQAREALQKMEIFGYLVIPPDFDTHLYNGSTPTLSYYYHMAILAIGEEVNGAFLSILSNVAASFLGETGEAAGLTSAQVKAVAMPVNSSGFPIYNPDLDFSVYISYPFIFVFLQILILIFTVYVIGSEIRDNSWIEAAGGNRIIAITGKLLPYFLLFCGYVLLANYICFALLHIPFSSGFLPLISIGILLVAATMSIGVVFITFIPNISVAISIASMYGALGATTCGVTFPIEDMSTGVQIFAGFFPIRYFTHIYHNLIYQDLCILYSWKYLIALGIFIIPAFILPKNSLDKLLNKESAFKNLPRIYGVILIALGGTVGYSLLYNIMYLPNLVEKVPVAIVDESKTPLSRKYANYLNATQGISVYSNGTGYAQAKELMKSHRVRGILYIPENFSTRIHQGEESVFLMFGTTTSFLYYLTIQESAVATMQKINEEYRNTIVQQLPPQGKLALAHAPKISVSGIPLYNHNGGYASFLLPIVFIVALFQTMLMAIGVYAGGDRTTLWYPRGTASLAMKMKSKTNRLASQFPSDQSILSIKETHGKPHTGFSKYLPDSVQIILQFTLLYFMLSLFVVGLVPGVFNLPNIGNYWLVFPFIFLFLLVTGIAGTFLAKFFTDAESVTLIVPFFSIGLIFLSGMSFPREQMPLFWQGFYYLFPCSAAITGYVKLSSMGAGLNAIMPEIIILVIQGAVYSVLLYIAEKVRSQYRLNKKTAPNIPDYLQ